MFKDPFSFYGRIRRTEYALTTIGYFFILFIISALAENAGQEWMGILILLPVYLMISQGVKRCHDLGRSGWWIIIPFYGFVMLFGPGDYGPNEYGDNPKGEGNDIYQDPFGYDIKTGTFNQPDADSAQFSVQNEE
ncbi:DUF805 domain-containing protein [Pedobacter chinensis]|uniref:DUF805 domain-containing protein n=1 Tax=Pedobacter chinensis TaxID=2282421 RepID=A0A369PZ93_9SPHI|nr:DUF805 domain-containing protein [Pedobacter chinensis]RDC57953.1 DUF805 domain-containing protein [Pedobacter chinensis]